MRVYGDGMLARIYGKTEQPLHDPNNPKISRYSPNKGLRERKLKETLELKQDENKG